MFSFSTSTHHAMQTMLCNIMCVMMATTLSLPKILTTDTDNINSILILVVLNSVNNYCQSNASLHDDSTEQSDQAEKTEVCESEKRYEEVEALKKQQQKYTKYIRIYAAVVSVILEPIFFVCCLDTANTGNTIRNVVCVLFVFMRFAHAWHLHALLNSCNAVYDLHTEYFKVCEIQNILVECSTQTDSESTGGVYQRIAANTATNADYNHARGVAALKQTMKKLQALYDQLEESELSLQKIRKEYEEKTNDNAMQPTRISNFVIFCMGACMCSVAIYPQLWPNIIDYLVYFKSQVQGLRVLQ